MRLPNKFIILDTEYTAWSDSQKTNWSNPNHHKEIIQIGALKVFRINNNFILKNAINIYVEPSVNKTLSKYITNLTGITNYKIKKYGVSFEIAIQQLRDFCYDKNTHLPVFSYGNDYDVIKENLILNKMNSKKDSKYYNDKKYYNDIVPILKSHNVNTNKYSSGDLYKYFDIKGNFKNHNAVSDVYSIYLSLKHMLLNDYNI